MHALMSGTISMIVLASAGADAAELARLQDMMPTNKKQCKSSRMLRMKMKMKMAMASDVTMRRRHDDDDDDDDDDGEPSPR